ncbi:hypothetical protein [Arthrobacter sp. NicSoilB8]|uniref:hypothetical protein n=1 Tax=Arthrobacter sp. NicSoilB8 TaxID=2830998 RepID=UPI001CC7709B|nr:hypothetical protein [Arthrobacter sp. NicSoilB8]BCW73096.1 hypothetical protein NicSoilB8_41400 [Arthrobacter sp. NicSoilB8]
MTEPLPRGDGTPALPAELPAALASELQAIIQAVDGVTAVYPARPLWQTIAGAARSAVIGEAHAPVDVTTSGAGTAVTAVKARIGVSGAYPAPDVARAVAAAVRRHLSPQPVTVQVGIVRISTAPTDSPQSG